MKVAETYNTIKAEVSSLGAALKPNYPNYAGTNRIVFIAKTFEENCLEGSKLV